MKKPTAEVYDILDEIEETLKGLYVAVLVADAEPDSITSENMTAYMHMLSADHKYANWKCQGPSKK